MPSVSDYQLTNMGYNDLAKGVSDIFQGFGDLYKMQGMKLEASNYFEAANFAGLNADIQHQSTKVQTAQVQRQVFQVTGQESAAVAAGNFASGGTAGDLMRMSGQQGALQKAVVNETGQLKEMGYREEQKADIAMGKAAEAEASADKMGMFGSFAGGGMMLGAAALLLL